MPIYFDIEGLDEFEDLERAFIGASEEVQDAIDRATEKSAEKLRDMIESELRRSDIRRRNRDGESIYDSFRVRKTRNGYEIFSTTDYAESLEFGTRPRTIRARNGEVLRFIGSNGQVVYASEINHPGIRARGFWRRAINRFDAQDVYKENLSDEIQKVFERKIS